MAVAAAGGRGDVGGSECGMGESGGAFLKGGLGCLAVLIVIGVAAVWLGGTVEVSLGGVILLFLVGGLIGLAAWTIYERGRRDVSRKP